MAHLDVAPDITNPEFEALLNYLKHSHHFDFAGYKRSSLMRRVQIRLQALRIESYGDYCAYLKKNPQEFIELFNTIEINFTSFFRDLEAWNYVGAQIVPQIVAAKSDSQPLRIWSAGCATGEEAYTLALVLIQALGLEQFRHRVKIFATDVDSDAINFARRATYEAKQIAAVPAQLRVQYFSCVDSRYILCPDLRSRVIFGCHNLIEDPPISGIDLLVCRNVSIYFNIETQTTVFQRLHRSLNDKGFLFLGKSEIPTNHANLLTSVSVQHHVLAKVPKKSFKPMLLPGQTIRVVGK